MKGSSLGKLFQKGDACRYIYKYANICCAWSMGHLYKTWRWHKEADLQLSLTIPAPLCVSLSRLARGNKTKMCEGVGEGGGCRGVSHLDESCAVCVDGSGKDGSAEGD